GGEALARRRITAARRARQRKRKRAVGAPLELVARDQALLDAERRQAGQRALVVARGEVVARLHALDRMAVLVHVEDAEPDGERIERVDALLPVLVEGLRVGRMANRAEALRPAE